MFSKLADRNNTSFPKELYEALKTIKLAKDDFLRYHQKIVVDYLMKVSNIRGLLAYHKMGSENPARVAICEILLKLYPDRRVIFIANKSLHGNFRKTIIKYHELANDIDVDQIEAHIKKNYSFVTMNASNMLKQVHAATQGETLDEYIELQSSNQNGDLVLKEDDVRLDVNLDRAIVVMDEFHNLLNSISNGSKNAVGLYDAGMRAEDAKFIGLTGTPVVNDPYEAAIGFNLFAGPIKDPTKKGSKSITTLFGEDYSDFLKMFVENPQAIEIDSQVKARPRIKHRDKFCDRIMGLVSYYGADTEEAAQFPTEFDILVQRIPMSYKQYAFYATARDKELEENKRSFVRGKPARLKKSSGASSSSYRVRSRQISNYLYPTYATKSWRTETGNLKYEQYIDKLLPESLQLPALNELSPKITRLLQNISIHSLPGILDEFRPPKDKLAKLIKKRTEINKKKLDERGLKSWAPGIGPGVVYSQFLDSGVNLVARILDGYGWSQFETGTKGPKYAIVSGEVPPEVRDQLIIAFNDPANKDGSKLALLLITQTGAEGLDLKHGRHVHVLEPYWHWSRIRQIITRIVRLGSHIDLPQEAQTVQPYMYLSDYPIDGSGKTKDDRIQIDLELRMKSEETTDVTLYHKAMQNQMLIDDFLSAMQDASIDCAIHYNDKNCRICSPTGKVLWHADLATDIDEPSPCEPYVTSKVRTKSVVLDGVEYRWSDLNGSIKLFEFAPSLQAWHEIGSESPVYEALIAAIEKKKK